MLEEGKVQHSDVLRVLACCTALRNHLQRQRPTALQSEHRGGGEARENVRRTLAGAETWTRPASQSQLEDAVTFSSRLNEIVPSVGGGGHAQESSGGREQRREKEVFLSAELDSFSFPPSAGECLTDQVETVE